MNGEIEKLINHLKEDITLDFLDAKDKKLHYIATIAHTSDNAINTLLNLIKKNPIAELGILYHLDNDFLCLAKKNNALLLLSNRKHIAPILFARSIAVLLSWVYSSEFFNELKNLNLASQFYIANLNVSILTQNKAIDIGDNDTLKVHIEENKIHYMQKFKVENIFSLYEKMCEYNIELAIPVSYIEPTPISMNHLVPIEKLESISKECQEKNIFLNIPDKRELGIKTMNNQVYCLDFEVEKKNENYYQIIPKYIIDEFQDIAVSKEEKEDIIRHLPNELQKKLYEFVYKNYGSILPRGYDDKIFSLVSMVEEGIRVSEEKKSKNLFTNFILLSYFKGIRSQDEPELKNTTLKRELKMIPSNYQE